MAMDTCSKNVKGKKETVEEKENGRDSPADGNADEEYGKQEAHNGLDEEESGGWEEEEVEGDCEEDGMKMRKQAPTGRRVAEDYEDDDGDTKKQKTNEDV
ncbi:prothymosin alpha [Cricetulus griseus]|uniref:Prothymosin alpha n=1 Tax=Cricetulus griseus TaxID=10029 RepID=G3HPL0_CRIGR|nr:prothymosin alpha [Cricetulus griseus]XP_027254517.1 prothymosin alpha [Cricetulus griseus]EGW03211.1 hypothetical protein I79_012724 [Cricetulus griseus]